MSVSRLCELDIVHAQVRAYCTLVKSPLIPAAVQDLWQIRQPGVAGITKYLLNFRNELWREVYQIQLSRTQSARKG